MASFGEHTQVISGERRSSTQLLARQTGNPRPQSPYASLTYLSIVSRLNIHVLPARPLPGMSLRYTSNLRHRQIRKVQLPLQPQRHRSRNKARTMTSFPLLTIFENVLRATMLRDRPLHSSESFAFQDVLVASERIEDFRAARAGRREIRPIARGFDTRGPPSAPTEERFSGTDCACIDKTCTL